MNYYRVPIHKFELPWYTFTTTLDGIRYSLTVRYNSRMDRWFLDIADAQQSPILSGIPLLIYRSLIYQYATLALPPGNMFVSDDSGRELQPTMQSFLLDHSLFYVSVN